jgi:hypothetical protein
MLIDSVRPNEDLKVRMSPSKIFLFSTIFGSEKENSVRAKRLVALEEVLEF